MYCWDLFCGTKSIGKAFEKEGFDVLTLDFDTQHDPDIVTDILEWDYKQYECPDVIWASPPCTTYSIASIGHHRRKVGWKLKPKTEFGEISDQIIVRTLEIIKHFKPKYWFIENPRGALRKNMYMPREPRVTITYDMYGDSRMKPTDIWGTFPKGFPIRMSKNGDDTHESAPRGSKTGTQGLCDAVERARIPDDFCNLLAKMIREELEGKSSWWW